MKALKNMIAHYFGDHQNCRNFEVKDDVTGELIIWCGFHKEGADYKPKGLPHGKWLQKTVKAPGKQGGTLPLRQRMDDVIAKYANADIMGGAVSGMDSNANESLHWSAVVLSGGKHTFRGQGGHYVTAMRSATALKVAGASWFHDVQKWLELPVTARMRMRTQMEERRRVRNKAYHKRRAAKLSRAERKSKRKKIAWKKDLSYTSGIAMNDKEAILAAGEPGTGDDGDDDSDASGEEKSDSDDEERCGGCGKAGCDDEGGNMMLLCDGMKCAECWHMKCLPERLSETPEGDWFCPVCVLFALYASESDM